MRSNLVCGSLSGLANKNGKNNQPIQPTENTLFVTPADRQGDWLINALFYESAVDM